MKRTILIALSVLVVSLGESQCLIDPGAQVIPGVNPTADQLPCIISGVPYNQTLQGKIQESDDISIVILNLHLVVDSMRIDSIGGIPNGISWSRNPEVLLGGGNGCVNFSGTTHDPPGIYNLTAFGAAWLRVTSPIPFAIPFRGSLNRFSPFGDYFLRVIEPGESCDALGIKDFNAGLNSAFTVYPNPNSGMVNLKLNAGKRLNGEIMVIDLIGRTVFTQQLDVTGPYQTSIDLTQYPKGIYTVQLRTAEGFGAKNISIE